MLHITEFQGKCGQTVKIEYLKLTSFKFLNFDKVGGMLVSLLELKISVSSLVSCPSSEGIIPVINSVSFMTHNDGRRNRYQVDFC